MITLENTELVQAIGQPVTSQWKIAQLVFRPDATWVVEPLEAGGIELRDFYTRKIVNSLPDAGLDIDLIIVSPDGRRLATISSTRETVSVWNLDGFIHLGTYAFSGYHSFYYAASTNLLAGSFSHDNRYLAVAGCLQIEVDRSAVCKNAGAVVYDLSAKEIDAELAGYQSATYGVAFSPDGMLLALAGLGKSTPRSDLLVWDVIQDKALVMLASPTSNNDAGLFDIDFNCTGDRLASTTASSTLVVWDTSMWQAQEPVEGNGPGKVRYSLADCALLVTADGLHTDGLTFWNAQTRRPIVTREPDSGIIYNLAVSPGGRHVYTWSDDLSGVYKIQEWGIP